MNINFSLLSTIVLLLVQMGLGIYVLQHALRTKGAFSFAFFCFSLSLWGLGAYFLYHAQTTAQVEFWGRYIYLGPVLIAYFFLYFTFVFPRDGIKNGLKFFIAVPTVCFLLLIPTPFILKKGILTAAGPLPTWGLAYPFFVFYFLWYFSWGVYNLLVKYKKARGNEKVQIGYVSLGLFLAFFFGIVFNLVFPAAGVARFLNLGPYFTLMVVGFTAYAIVKHRLMDISVVISRVAAEVLTIFILGSIYLCLVWLYTYFLPARIDPPFIVMSILYGVIVGQSHQRLRLFLQTTSDKLFLRGKYDYYKVLSEASMRVGQKLSFSSIINILYETFQDVIEAKDPKVFLPEFFLEPGKVSSRYLAYDPKTHKPRPDGDAMAFDSSLAHRLVDGRIPIIDPHNPAAELVVPCLLENRLIAIFVLGPKLSEDPYTNEDVKLLEVLASQAAVALDHTRSYEKISSDLEIVERQLQRSQRLASLGTLTAGVTHEIRNPLTVIRAETERLANKERDLPYLKNFQQLVIKHVDRITNIIQRMLRLAKEKPKQQAAVNLNEVVNSALQLFAISRIILKKDLGNIPTIMGDPEELEEVFMNLIQNAIEVMPQGGDLTIRTYVDHGRVVAEVSDTGKGIPEELHEKIFDPFFSTRHEGVGLGLSIVYRIVRSHGGDLKVMSEVGKGTTFRISFSC